MKKLSNGACGLFLVFAFSACDAPAANVGNLDMEEAAVADADDRLAIAADTADNRAIIATIELDGEAQLRFVDESVSGVDGGVGVLSIGLKVEGMTELGLSPLELYMALAPGEAAPERLKEHHARVVAQQGRTSGVVRQVPVEHASETAKTWSIGEPLKVLTQSTGFVPSCMYIFAPPPQAIYWYTLFCGNVASQGGYAWCNATTAVVGSVGYAYTGSAGERWLGACAPTTSMDWVVQSELIAGLWSDVSGTSVSLTSSRWVEYTSTSMTPANYRSKVLPATTGQTIQFGAARN